VVEVQDPATDTTYRDQRLRYQEGPHQHPGISAFVFDGASKEELDAIQISLRITL